MVENVIQSCHHLYSIQCSFFAFASPNPPPRKQKSEFFQQSYFDNTDRFKLFADFLPEKALLRKYSKVLMFRLKHKITIIFMNESKTQVKLLSQSMKDKLFVHQALLWPLRRESEFLFHET